MLASWEWLVLDESFRVYRCLVPFLFISTSGKIYVEWRGFFAGNLIQRLDASYCTKIRIGYVHCR